MGHVQFAIIEQLLFGKIAIAAINIDQITGISMQQRVVSLSDGETLSNITEESFVRLLSLIDIRQDNDNLSRTCETLSATYKRVVEAQKKKTT